MTHSAADGKAEKNQTTLLPIPSLANRIGILIQDIKARLAIALSLAT